MDNIKKLEEIGLRKVCEETHIEQKYLKYMVDCDYDKLNIINTRGFIKILSREYKIDLSAWSEAFEEYWIKNRKDQEDNGLFIVVDDEENSKKPLRAIIAVLVCAALVAFFLFFQKNVDFSNYTDNKKENYEQATIVKEVQKKLDESRKSTQNIIIAEEKPVNDENTTSKTIQEEIEEKKSKASAEMENLRFDKKAIIVSKSQLWVGVIYLDTKKRKSYLKDGNFSIDMSREQIITTGHGSFDLNIGEVKKKYRKQEPIRFWIKDNNVTQINWRKFKELNEGEPW